MATPEMRSIELDPLVPSIDEDLEAVEIEQNQVVEAETRVLPAYSFDSDDKTLAGIGTSDSADSCEVRHFDSSDRTLVGIGPAERAKHAKLAELASRLQLAESAPESVPVPQSEPPGPFITSNEEDEVPARLPMQKGGPWLVALSGMLAAAAAFALVRGVSRQTAAPRLHSAMAVASAVELPLAPAREAPQPTVPPAAEQREQEPELAPRHPRAKSAGAESLGALEVISNPPSGLVLDGRPLGKAPRVIQLPSGPHTVLFVHPERGRMSVTVNVRAGRTTIASADF